MVRLLLLIQKYLNDEIECIENYLGDKNEDSDKYNNEMSGPGGGGPNNEDDSDDEEDKQIVVISSEHVCHHLCPESVNIVKVVQNKEYYKQE